MRIILAGCGKLGSMVVANLVRENHHVTVIDKDENALDKLSDIDVLTVKGNAVSLEALEEADVKHADILIATTISDESNMLCCIMGKKLGAKYTVARIREPQYLNSFGFITQQLSIDYVANPERATAREIGRMLRFPYASSSIETFARGLVEMVELRVNADDMFVNIRLCELYKRITAMPRVLFCGVRRGDEAFVPNGDFIIREGDLLSVTADYKTMTAFFRFIGRSSKVAKDALIIGGSRIAYYLVSILNESGIKTKLIELKPEKARQLDELLEKTTIICGDGTDQQLLLSEGLQTTDSFIALTDRDEENLMAGLYASKVCRGRLIVKNNRVNYSELLSSLGMDGIISPTQIACNMILKIVRAREAGESSGVERMYKIMGGQAEALEFIAPNDAPYLNHTLSELTVSDSSLVAVIVRGNKVIVPFGSDTIEAQDHVIVITKKTAALTLGDILKL